MAELINNAEATAASTTNNAPIVHILLTPISTPFQPEEPIPNNITDRLFCQ